VKRARLRAAANYIKRDAVILFAIEASPRSSAPLSMGVRVSVGTDRVMMGTFYNGLTLSLQLTSEYCTPVQFSLIRFGQSYKYLNIKKIFILFRGLKRV